MRLLLDTHVLLWWMADDRKLGKTARRQEQIQSEGLKMTTLGKLLVLLGIAFIACITPSKESRGQTQTLTAF